MLYSADFGKILTMQANGDDVKYVTMSLWKINIGPDNTSVRMYCKMLSFSNFNQMVLFNSIINNHSTYTKINC